MSRQSVSTLAYMTLWQSLYEPQCIHVANDNAMVPSLSRVTDASIILTVVWRMCYIVEMKAGLFFSPQRFEHRSSCMLGEDFIIDISTPNAGVFLFFVRKLFFVYGLYCLHIFLCTTCVFIQVRRGHKMPVVTNSCESPCRCWSQTLIFVSRQSS